MAHTFSCSADAPLVRTTGGSVRGYRFDGLDIFKGIPYAKARRFHAPEPAMWDGVLDATSYGYVCPLLEMPKPNGEMLVPHRYWLMNEACQNLNIWTPALDDAHRPVLVWLHGGGYFAGSSIEQIAYEGENMARLGDCVVVSINHRLNILGYLDLSDFGVEYANSGNAGGDDIIAALRWVRDNIAAFGGDPGNVTVFGQSGGGAKVTTLLQTPAADGLFHKGIVMSGVLGRLADCTGSGRDCAEALMAELGAADIAALETIPYAALAAAYNKVAPALKAAGKNTGCAPHPNAFYLGDPLENAFRPETARIPPSGGHRVWRVCRLQWLRPEQSADERRRGRRLCRKNAGQADGGCPAAAVPRRLPRTQRRRPAVFGCTVPGADHALYPPPGGNRPGVELFLQSGFHH